MSDRSPIIGSTEFAWLIEKGQPEGYDDPIYYEGTTEFGDMIGGGVEHEWTDDPFRAARLSEADAIEGAAKVGGRAVQHGFMHDISSDPVDGLVDGGKHADWCATVRNPRQADAPVLCNCGVDGVKAALYDRQRDISSDPVDGPTFGHCYVPYEFAGCGFDYGDGTTCGGLFTDHEREHHVEKRDISSVIGSTRWDDLLADAVSVDQVTIHLKDGSIVDVTDQAREALARQRTKS